jgi:DNA polymerase-3 subunit delta'
VLIWLPEYLHSTAANALLKVIEEPPPYTIFLLVSHQPEKVLGTIHSRTQQIHIPAFTDEALSAMLTRQHALNQEPLAQIILLANGNFNKALKLVESMEGNSFSGFKEWMRLCYAHDFTHLVARAEGFQEMPKTGQRDFLAYALHMLRETLVLCFAQKGLSRATDAEQVFIQKLKMSLTYQQIQAWTSWLDEAYYHIERNANPRMVHLNLSLKISQTFKP